MFRMIPHGNHIILAVSVAFAAATAIGPAKAGVNSGFPAGAQLKSIVDRSHLAATKAYKTGGFEGMMNAIRICYGRLPKQANMSAVAECASLDLSAFYIEQGASQEFQAADQAMDDYMSGDKFENRMDKYLPPHTGKSSDLMARHDNFAAMVHAYRGN